MRSRVLLILAGIVGLFLLSTSALAHHGAASLYDVSKETTLKVTITEFMWTNPHVEVGIASVEDKNARWLLELGSPPNIANRGWTSKSLKVGDVVGHLQPRTARDRSARSRWFPGRQGLKA